eukprot:9088827-Alexandrium_andersonii.AAC.1
MCIRDSRLARWPSSGRATLGHDANAMLGHAWVRQGLGKAVLDRAATPCEVDFGLGDCSTQ